MAGRYEFVLRGDKALRARLNATGGRVFRELHRAFRHDGQEFHGEMQGRFRGGGPIHRRTGALARSIGYDVRGTNLPQLSLRAFSAGRSYARAQEFGAEIRPKRARMLAIPGPDNQTPSGVARHPSAREFISAHKGQIDFVPIEGGARVLIFWHPTRIRRQRGGGDEGATLSHAKKGKLMFILQRNVTLPGPKTDGSPSRLGFFDTWNRLRPSRTARHRAALARGLASK